jgi:hypothetical protein
MPLAFTSSVPRFRVTFNLASAANTITVYDLINSGYSAYGTVTNFKGLLKITDPDNIIIFQNTGWSLTTPDFASPDINGSGSVWTKAATISLPTAVKLGTYTFTYIASIDPTGNPTRTNFVTVTKQYDYEWATPVVEIDYDLSCRTSELTSTDSTDYAVTISNVTYTPTTTRTHTLIKPAGAGCNSPAAVSTAAITWGAGGTALTDLWTNVWQTTISTVAVYNLETWSGDNWFVVSATITGSDSIDVQCSDCICNLRLCINNLIEDWVDTIGTNYKRESEMRTKVIKILAKWEQYQIAEQCGESTDTYCEEIKEIAASEDCECNTDTDAASARVVAWGNGTGQATASTFAFTISASDPTGGNTGDVCYQSTTYHIWRKDSGWVDYGSIRGAAGGDGPAGTNESLLDHDYADHACTATGVAQELYSYSMDANSVAASDDVLEITANYLLASSDNGKTLILKWGGTDILTYYTDSLVNTSNNVVKLKAWITRTGSATQDIELIAQRSGYPPSHISLTTGTEDFTGVIVIYANCTSATSTASDITLKEFKAELHNMI